MYHGWKWVNRAIASLKKAKRPEFGPTLVGYLAGDLIPARNLSAIVRKSRVFSSLG